MTFKHAIKLLISFNPESRRWGKKLLIYNYNRLKFAKKGEIKNFKTRDEWISYHERHGQIYGQPDGHLCCDGCGEED